MPASGKTPAQAGLSSRLRELGIGLPEPPSPLGAYVPASKAGSLLFLSGMLPLTQANLS